MNTFFSIILPAHNEEENLSEVLTDLKNSLNAFGLQSEMIVVNDGSTDNTKEVLQSLEKQISQLKTINIENNGGYGNAIIQGMNAAQGNILAFMDSDGQARSADLISLYKELVNKNLDICKGVRINRAEGFIRKFISKSYNVLFRVMFGVNSKDIDGGPVIFTRHFYETAKLVSKDFFIDAEILIKAKRNNFSIMEMPVVPLERKRGKSTVNFSNSISCVKNMLVWFLFQ
ncbi:MAG: glycosyltransferase family 2 protein [Candidatus Nealsonbacteria bacterium]|nr:glycosyltransferase family 2 protein [Candidatus Nealsonbacteria bacterium]